MYFCQGIASEVIGNIPTTGYSVDDVKAAIQALEGSQKITENDVVNSQLFFFNKMRNSLLFRIDDYIFLF